MGVSRHGDFRVQPGSRKLSLGARRLQGQVRLPSLTEVTVGTGSPAEAQGKHKSKG